MNLLQLCIISLTLFSFTSAYGEDWTGACVDQSAYQSPININGPFNFINMALEMSFTDVRSNNQFLVNNGQSLVLKGDFGFLKHDNITFSSYEMVLKSPSEHSVGNEKTFFPLEVQVKLASSQGAKLNLAFLFNYGGDSDFLEKLGFGRGVLKNLMASQEYEVPQAFNVQTILPLQNRFFVYRGSDTVPPCEATIWLVAYDTLKASQKQINDFPSTLVYKSRDLQNQKQEIFINFNVKVAEEDKQEESAAGDTPIGDASQAKNAKGEEASSNTKSSAPATGGVTQAPLSQKLTEDQISEFSKIRESFILLGDSTIYDPFVYGNDLSVATKFIKDADYIVVQNIDENKLKIENDSIKSIEDIVFQKMTEEKKWKEENKVKLDEIEKKKAEQASIKTQETAGKEELGTPTGIAAASSKGVATTTEGEAASAEGQAASAEGQASTTEGQAIPAEGQVAPTEGQATPAEAASVEGQAAPAETAPAEEQATPTEAAPVEEEATSAEVSSAEGQVNPAETASVEGQAAPAETAPVEVAPAEGQAASAEATPAEEQATPTEAAPAEGQAALISINQNKQNKNLNNQNGNSSQQDINLIEKSNEPDNIQYINEISWPDICKNGQSQSPVKLDSKIVEKNDGEINVYYDQSDAKPSLKSGNNLSLLGQYGTIEFQDHLYDVSAVHIKIPAEHIVEGQKRSDIEFQIEHESMYGKKLMVSVLGEVSEGKINQFLTQIGIQDSKQEKFDLNQLQSQIDSNPEIQLNQLIDSLGKHYRYDGSLNFPPCTQGIYWIVKGEKVNISKNQLETAKSLLENKGAIRKLQSANDRKVYYFEQ